MTNSIRRAAFEAGETKYVSGGTCKSGHTGPRWVANGGCVECNLYKRAIKPPTPTVLQAIVTLNHVVSKDITEEQRVKLENYLVHCVEQFHIAQELYWPVNKAQLQIAEQQGIAFSKVKL